MKVLGYLMIIVSFLAGALVAVLDKSQVRWNFFVPALAVGIAGIALVQIGERRKNLLASKLASGIQGIEASLSRIVENLARLNADKNSLNPYDVRHRIDEFFPENLDTFVEARETIAHVHGLQAYADVMSYFAAGERYLNRAWSASADGYVDEVNTYLDRAYKQFGETLQRLTRLSATTS